MIKQTVRIFLPFVTLFFAMSAQASDTSRYGIPNSAVHAMSSELTGSDYELLVWVPNSYTKEPDRKYPVIYILDGQWDFSNVEASIRNNFADGAIPEVILVGISFGGETEEHMKIRTHDYLPTKVIDGDSSKGGGGPQFLQFIQEGIIPFIESNYRVDASYRVLGGCSYGGLFVLYAMMEETDLFDAYISLGPSLWWDDRSFLSELKSRVEESQPMKVRLWLGVGLTDREKTVKRVKAFYEQMKLIKPDGFLLEFRALEGEGHSGMKAEAYNRGLRFVFGHLNKPADLP